MALARPGVERHRWTNVERTPTKLHYPISVLYPNLTWRNLGILLVDRKSLWSRWQTLNVLHLSYTNNLSREVNLSQPIHCHGGRRKPVKCETIVHSQTKTNWHKGAHKQDADFIELLFVRATFSTSSRICIFCVLKFDKLIALHINIGTSNNPSDTSFHTWLMELHSTPNRILVSDIQRPGQQLY